MLSIVETDCNLFFCDRNNFNNIITYIKNKELLTGYWFLIEDGKLIWYSKNKDEVLNKIKKDCLFSYGKEKFKLHGPIFIKIILFIIFIWERKI